MRHQKAVHEEPLNSEILEVWRETGMQSHYHAMSPDYISPREKIRILEAKVEAIAKHFGVSFEDIPSHLELKEEEK